MRRIDSDWFFSAMGYDLVLFLLAKQGLGICCHSDGAMLDTHPLPIKLPCGSGFQSSIRFGGTDLKNVSVAYRIGTIVFRQYNRHTSTEQQTRSIQHSL